MEEHSKRPPGSQGHTGYPVTSWTLVLNAAQQPQAKGKFYELYRGPLGRLLRRKGFSEADAEEYTQDFLTHILRDGSFFDKIRREEARRFHSFLAKAFLNHVFGRLRKRRTRSLGDTALDLCAPADLQEAGRALDYEWAAGILEDVKADVKAQCQREGLDTHWQVFVDRVLMPILERRERPPLPALCLRYGIPSPSQASNMIVTVERRFEKTLKQSLMDATDSPRGFSDVLQDFISCFSQE